MGEKLVFIDEIKLQKNLKEFKKNDVYLKIFKREAPVNSDLFFKKICNKFSSISCFINHSTAENDIHDIFAKVFNSEIKSDPFYTVWLNDMSNICKIYCKFLEEHKISFWIGTNRGCKRYHIDMVPFRVLVTYSGQGTELLPDEAANRQAFFQGKPNDKIVRDKSKIRFARKWDITFFKGGKDGILHRTPDAAQNKGSSLLMRLDNSSFLESIREKNDLD